MTQRKYTQRTPEQWQNHVDCQKESGLSIAAYCQENGLAVSNFYGWRKRLLCGDSGLTNKTQDPSAAWVAITPESPAINSIPAASAGTEITLTLPSNIQLTIHCR